MRILYVTDGFAPFVIGGMQVFARRQIEALIARGHEVISVSSRTPAGVHVETPWLNHDLSWPQNRGLARLSPWRYVRQLRAFSVPVSGIADQVQPDVIYSEGALVYDYLRRPRRAAAVVFHPHGLEMFQHKGSVVEDTKSLPLRKIFGDHARRADRVGLLSSEGALDRIVRRLGVADQRIAVIPNAAPDQPEAVPRRKREERFKLLFLGRDEPRKGLSLLLSAVTRLPEIELDVVGLSRPGGAPNVRFHGPISDRGRVAQFLAGADMLVVPSYAEGLSTVILEAFAHGLPVIATDVGANASLVGARETGFLIEAGNEHALEQAIRGASRLSDKAYSALSHNALVLARGPYASERVADQLVAALDAAIKDRQAA